MLIYIYTHNIASLHQLRHLFSLSNKREEELNSKKGETENGERKKEKEESEREGEGELPGARLAYLLHYTWESGFAGGGTRQNSRLCDLLEE